MAIRSAVTLARISRGIEGKRTFQGTSALRGARVRNVDDVPVGRLTPFQADTLRRGIRSGIIKFVIWSYETPIAWWGPVRSIDPNIGGSWVFNTARFGNTTTDHQRVERRFINFDFGSPMSYLIDM